MNWIKPGFLAFIFSFSLMISCNNNTSNTESNAGQIEDTASAGKQQLAAVYTCPMHPEVTSDQPGKCPKCGMDLVKKADSTETHDDNADSRLGK
ncbi:MAG TPA: heavy metal-binding domain-containing protein [Lentimicrobium sp.]|nr:heavy metal-binding domain-containing protein [Lentimicrobium sp.]